MAAALEAKASGEEAPFMSLTFLGESGIFLNFTSNVVVVEETINIISSTIGPFAKVDLDCAMMLLLIS